MNKEKFIVPKSLFMSSFVAAIVTYALFLILNIAELIIACEHIGFSSYWYLYVNIVLSIFVALGILLASALILTLTKEKDKGGEFLMKFFSYYVLVIGTYSFITAVFNAIFVYSVPGIISLIFSILEIGLGCTNIVLVSKKPKVARIILIVECILLAILNLIDLVSYALTPDYIDLVVSLFVFLFDISIVVTFSVMKVESDDGTKVMVIEDKTPLSEKKTSEEEQIDLLLKYKDLLDKGVISQEEFDLKRKNTSLI